MIRWLTAKLFPRSTVEGYQRHLDSLPHNKMVKVPCSVEGCEFTNVARAWSTVRIPCLWCIVNEQEEGQMLAREFLEALDN